MFNPNQARAAAVPSFRSAPQAQAAQPAFGQKFQGMAGTSVAAGPPQYGGGGAPQPGSYDGVAQPSGPPPGYGYVWNGTAWVRQTPPRPGEYGGSSGAGG